MNQRAVERYNVVVEGPLRTTAGKRPVSIVNLSAQGCRVSYPFGHVAKNSAVTIKIGPVGPIEGRVRWHDQPFAGIVFDQPLHATVVEHLRAHFDMAEPEISALEVPKVA